MRKLVVLNSLGMLPPSVIPTDIARLTAAQQLVVGNGGHTAVLNATNSALVDPSTGMDIVLGQGVYVPLSVVGQPSGVAPLGTDGKIASAYLPGAVDSIVEVASYSALPVVGQSSKIYVTLDTNKQYRWGGSVYVMLSPSPGTTDDLTEGTTNKYFSESLVRGTVLTGINASAAGVVAATDSILVGFGKLQSQVTSTSTQVSNHILSTSNPHSVTATQVGLGNVDNTRDIDKPVSTATQTALNLKLNVANPTFTGTLTGPLVSTDAVQFNLAYAGTTGIGKLTWNSTDGTLDLGLVGGNVTLQIGQEEVIYVLNNTGSTILNGYVARVTGSQGQRLTAAYAQANSVTLAQSTIGVITEDILNNQRGFVTCRGLVHGLNTSAFAENDVLWLSAATPGLLTNVEPAAPNISVRVGYCIKSHATDGHIYVSPQIGYNFDALNNVAFTTLVDGQIVSYSAASSTWVNTTLTKALVGLGNVDNTSDANKPVSTATQTALNLKLNATAPAYTGGLTGTGVVNLDSNQFYKDAVGHLGLGVVPHASWSSSAKVIDFQNRGSIGAGLTGAVGDIFLASNAYTAGADPGTASWLYRATGTAAKLELYNGTATIDTVVSGTLDTAITWTRGITVNSVGVGVRTATNTEIFNVGDGTFGITKAYVRIFGASTGADLYIGQSGGTVLGYTAGTIGLVYQNATAPLGILSASSDVLIGAGSNSIVRVKVSGTDGAVTINSSTASTTTTSGALVVTGGIATANNLYVGGLTNITGALTVGGAVTLTSGLALGQVKDDNGSYLYDDSIKNNLLEAPRWGTVNDGWTNYGVLGTNSQVYAVMPNGEYSPVWQGDSIVGQTGWFAGPYSKTIRVQPDRIYRLVLPFRRTSTNTDNHFLYIGAYPTANVVDTLNTSTSNSNLYFFAANITNIPANKWYRLVAYIYPAGVTGFANQAKVYDMDTGDTAISIASTLTDANWHAGTTVFKLRAGLYKSTLSTQVCTVQWGKPRFEVLDGSEAEFNSEFASLSGAGNSIGLVGTNVTIRGNKVQKTGGTASTWDAGAYSSAGYAGGCFLRFRFTSTATSAVIGLNDDPATDSNYTGINYGFYNSALNISSCENGTLTSLGTAAYGDILSITYDGVNIKYYKNGTILRTVAAVITVPLYMDSSIYTANAVIEDIDFGPLVSNNWADIGNKPTSGSNLTDVLFNNASGTITVNQNAATSLTLFNNDAGTTADTRITFNNGTNTGSLILRGTGVPAVANNVVLNSSAGGIQIMTASTERIGISAAGVVSLSNTTASTSTITGALKVAGGAGFVGDVYAASFNGSGAGLTSLTGANVTGTVANATTAVSVSGAAQTAITSVGTLTGLTSSGVVTVTNATASVSATTGAVIVTGGVGTSDAFTATKGLVSQTATLTTVVLPSGGKFYQGNSNLRGAFVITLPGSWTNTMLTIHLRVFSYAPNQGFDLVVSGYTYVTSTQWVNTSARLIGPPDTLQNHKVRFGHDGTKCVIVIGDENATTGSLWQYPQVEILRVSCGQSAYAPGSWNTGWVISLVNDVSTYTFTSTITNTQVNAVLAPLSTNQAASTGRSAYAVGAYTFNTLGATLGDTTPTAYWSTLGFGRGTGGGAELAAAWASSTGLWYRTLRDTTDNWTAWKEVLTSATYNNYSPTLTGTGASGSWGISITGSAATVTGAAQTAITSVGTLTGLTSSGVVNITNATDATSTSTGSLITAGGAGIGLSLWVGGTATVNKLALVTGSVGVVTTGTADRVVVSGGTTVTDGGAFVGRGSTAATNAGAVELWTYGASGAIRWLIGGTTGTGHITPATTNLYNIGSGTLRLAGLFSTNVDFSGTLTASTGAWTVGTTQLTKDASGNFGLGIASAGSLLHLYKSAVNTQYLLTLENDYSGAGTITDVGIVMKTHNGTASVAQGYLYTTNSLWTGNAAGANAIALDGVGTGGVAILAENNSGTVRVIAGGSSAAFLVSTSSSTGLVVNNTQNFNAANINYFQKSYSVATATAVTIEVSKGVTAPVVGTSYRIRLVTTGTSSLTGATYLVSYNGTTWVAQAVTVDARSNFPVLQVSGGVFQVFHNHASTYSITAMVEGWYHGNTIGSTQQFFGSDSLFTFDGSTSTTTSTSTSIVLGNVTADTLTIGGRSSAESAPGSLFNLPSYENSIQYDGTAYETTQVTCVADVAGSLAGKYFRIYGPAGTSTAVDPSGAEVIIDVWFVVSGTGTVPASGAGRYIQVTLTTGNTAIQVAAAISTALAADAAFSRVGVNGTGGVTIVAATPNNFTDASAGTSGFTVAKTLDGSGAITGASKYVGGVLAPNGKIYFIAYGSTAVRVYDPDTGSSYTIGSATIASAFIGGVLAPNGKVYGIPSNSSVVMEIDPSNDTIASFGALGATAGKWWGGVLAHDGKIYCAPNAAGNILVIDPVARTTSTIGSGLPVYNTGVLAPNGKIYFVPSSTTATGVLVLDVATGTYTTIGSLGATATKYMGGALAPNGKIYCAPYNATDFLVIDPIANTVTQKGSVAGTAKYGGAVLGPNGKIYCIPRTASSILVIDPSTETTTTIGSFGTTDKWIGGVLAPDGSIVCVPYNSTSILRIGGGLSTFPSWYLSAYFNKL